MPFKKLSTRRKKQLVKKIQDVILLVSDEVGIPSQDVKPSTVKSLIASGLEDDQIVSIYEVSYLDSSNSCCPIPIGTLKKFAFRFIGKHFTGEDLDSLVSQLRNIFVCSNSGANHCNKTLISDALKLAEEYEVYDMIELQEILVRGFYRDPSNQSKLMLGVILSEEEPNWKDELLEMCPTHANNYSCLHHDDVCHPDDIDQLEYERETYG